MISENLSSVSFGNASSIRALFVSAYDIVDTWPRFAGHLSQYESSLNDCHYDDSWGPLDGIVMKHQDGNDVFYEETNSGWHFSDLYLEMLALLKRNRLYFMKVERKKVSGRFWPSLVPAWVRQWIIEHPGKESFA